MVPHENELRNTCFSENCPNKNRATMKEPSRNFQRLPGPLTLEGSGSETGRGSPLTENGGEGRRTSG